MKCAQFYGNDVVKRSEGDTAVVPTKTELSYDAVKEAIVNAVCHRDYSSNASVQVMLFRNRLEVWNPGQLPYGLTVQKLLEPHKSIPTNPLIAEPMYLAGYIEKLGTGTEDILQKCTDSGLKAPEFHQEEDFKVVIWRQVDEDNPTSTPQVRKLVNSLSTNQLSVKDLMSALGLKERKNFLNNYLDPAIDSGYVEPLYPDSPHSPKQKYILTEKGKELLASLDAS